MKLTLGRSNNGLTIFCDLEDSHNCVEFSTKANTPQQILIAPWIQFEPIGLAEERTRIAAEIIRRAMVYEDLLKKIEVLEMALESYRKG